MADIPEVDTFKAFFLLFLGAALGAVIVYAWDQTIGVQITKSIAQIRAQQRVAA